MSLKSSVTLCHCLSFSCQIATMAGVLLSNRKFDKLIKNHVKFSKYVSNNQSVILNKPHLNLICKQCAVTSYFRVSFCGLNFGYFYRENLEFSMNFMSKSMLNENLCFLVLFFGCSKRWKWLGHRQKCFGGSVGKQTKNRKNPSW